MMTLFPPERALRGGILLAGLLLSGTLAALDPSAPECRPLQEQTVTYQGPEAFGRGLLWQLSKADTPPSYLFGTIHVAYRRVAEQLARVDKALATSRLLMLETLPEPEQVAQLQRAMFFSDGQQLSELVTPAIYRATTQILSAYHFNESLVALMQPWAAHLVMNYPAEFGAIVDTRLLELAHRQGIQTLPLETLTQQSALFRELALAEQAQLLTDSVCHYETLVTGFEQMIALYQTEDLAGMSAFAERYRYADNDLYETLTTKILTQRNARMIEKMLPQLEQGGVFVAVGALHLPGEQGLLTALAGRGFDVTRLSPEQAPPEVTEGRQ